MTLRNITPLVESSFCLCDEMKQHEHHCSKADMQTSDILTTSSEKNLLELIQLKDFQL
jgi:hypothetical protein